MCGRYFISSENAEEEIQALIAEMNRREEEKGTNRRVKTGDIFPGDEALVAALSRARNVKPFLMRWGFEMGKSLLINARSESAGEKETFRALIRERRLLVPASGYYEWEKRGKRRVKYALTTFGKGLYFAGVYRLTETGAEFVILTREAAPGIRFIHERMPVILRGEAARQWLSADCEPQTVIGQAEENVKYESEQVMMALEKEC